MQIEASSRWRDECVELFVLRPDHVTARYVGWLADPEINRYLESRFSEHSQADIESYVAQMMESERDLFLGIRSCALDRHVGNIRLGPIDRHHGRAEIGIMVGDRDGWGRGIATHALSLIGGIAKEELQLRKLAASCYASNDGSRRAFERAGFTTEGVRPAHLLLDGRPEDLVLMGRLLN